MSGESSRQVAARYCEAWSRGDVEAVLARERLTRSGESHEIRRLLRYRIAGDRFTECWLYDEDQVLVDRLWGTTSSPPPDADE
jgi:hypothetical protein